MTKFWLMTKSTTAALCLLGIGANAALGMEALARENDANDLDECKTFDVLADDRQTEDAIATDSTIQTCDSSLSEEAEIWEETEALDNSDPVEFEEFSDPSWQEDNAAGDTTEPLPMDTEAEWETFPDAASEGWESPITMEELEAEWELAPDVSAELDALPPTETVAPDVSAELDALPPTETIATEWDNVPDAASENWDNQIEWDNVPDISATEEVKPAIATETDWQNLEDDPQFQAVLEPEGAKEEVAKLAPEDLIRDDREVSELIVPTPEQQQAKTTGLPTEQVVRAAEDNSLPNITALESTVETPLLDRLDADLRRLRSQAEIVASQSLNTPVFAPPAIALETTAFNNYGAISAPELEQWAAKFEDEFNFEDEFALDTALDLNAIANSVDPQLFEQDLGELGLEIFDTTLFAGDAIASNLFFDGISFAGSSFNPLETDFNAVLAGWESASLTQDLTALIPAHLLGENFLSFEGEIPALSWQGEDIFAIESAFEELPELNFGNHPFEFGFKRDLLQARLPLPSKKSM